MKKLASLPPHVRAHVLLHGALVATVAEPTESTDSTRPVREGTVITGPHGVRAEGPLTAVVSLKTGEISRRPDGRPVCIHPDPRVVRRAALTLNRVAHLLPGEEGAFPAMRNGWGPDWWREHQRGVKRLTEES